MTPIRNFENLTAHLKAESVRKRIAVVCASDNNTEQAVVRALEDGFADLIMVGPGDILDRFSDLNRFPGRVSVIDVPDRDEAARVAVRLVREGRADVLMKGLINTDNLLRAILDKENGILPAGNVLTHVTMAEVPGSDRLIFFSDAAVIPYPSFAQRVEMVRYLTQTCRSFGISCPRVALVHCSEKVNAKMPVTLDYVRLVEMAGQGEFGEAIVDGPMDVKTACESTSGAIKGIVSPIGGKADALLFPDIESGNVFYKTLSLWAKARMAGMLRGTSAPVVLPSRSDSAESKYFSLAAACLM
ncbi:MAG: phosphate butyryltransferase [Muribaculaceae bacterium]|nr:phosphate butyryltransferase [Muribaculaceae bacterium]